MAPYEAKGPTKKNLPNIIRRNKETFRKAEHNYVISGLLLNKIQFTQC